MRKSYLRVNIALTLFVTLIALFNNNALYAQCAGCTPDISCNVTPAAPALCPDTLPNAMALQPYSEDISFYLPAQFTDQSTGYNVTLNELEILNVIGLPWGLTWEANSPNNKYYPSSNPPATEHGCARICGTPLQAGSYTITVFVKAQVSVFGIGQTQNDFFNIPLEVLPAVNSNNGFSMSNASGCLPLITSFTTNYPSAGNPAYSYSWDFGNGNFSNIENPLPQMYVNDGNFSVTHQVTIDTLGYYLSSVTLLAAPGCNDYPFSSPDYYFLLKQAGNLIYAAPYIDEKDVPVTFSFTPIKLSNTTYTVEFWEYDSGLAGDDDFCGAMSFNGYTAGTTTLTSGQTVATVTITHPVVQHSASDTVRAYAAPVISSFDVWPNDSVCAGDSARLFVVVSNAGSFQWFNDTVAILNANDSFYNTVQSGKYSVEIWSPFGCRTKSPVQIVTVLNKPPKPTFWISGNTLNTVSTAYLQWFLDGDSLAGASQQSMTIMASGNYHLTATNNSGCISSSDTVFIVYNNQSINELKFITAVKLFPNPAKGEINISFNLKSQTDFIVNIADFSGRTVRSSEYMAATGYNSLKIELGNLERGIYFINMEGQHYSLRRKFIVE